MAIEADASTGEPAGIDDAGVVGVVAENKVAGAREGRQDTEVGLVSRGKEKHGFNTEKGGEAGLKFTVLRKISGD